MLTFISLFSSRWTRLVCVFLLELCSVFRWDLQRVNRVVVVVVVILRELLLLFMATYWPGLAEVFKLTHARCGWWMMIMNGGLEVDQDPWQTHRNETWHWKRCWWRLGSGGVVLIKTGFRAWQVLWMWCNYNWLLPVSPVGRGTKGAVVPWKAAVF